MTSDPRSHGIVASRIDFAGGWNVTVPVMEFVRQDPLEGELRRRIGTALRSADGVETATKMDREVRYVTGTPSGPALVRAAAGALDDLDEQLRDFQSR